MNKERILEKLKELDKAIDSVSDEQLVELVNDVNEEQLDIHSMEFLRQT